MAKNNAYTVWVGRTPGVYDSWEECEKQVKGFPGAKYKGYPNREFAEAALQVPHEQIITVKSKQVEIAPTDLGELHVNPAQDECYDWELSGPLF